MYDVELFTTIRTLFSSDQNPPRTLKYPKSSQDARVAWHFNHYRLALHQGEPKIGLDTSVAWRAN